MELIRNRTFEKNLGPSDPRSMVWISWDPVPVPPTMHLQCPITPFPWRILYSSLTVSVWWGLRLTAGPRSPVPGRTIRVTWVSVPVSLTSTPATAHLSVLRHLDPHPPILACLQPTTNHTLIHIHKLPPAEPALYLLAPVFNKGMFPQASSPIGIKNHSFPNTGQLILK